MKQRRITVTFSEGQKVETTKGNIPAREWLSSEMKRLRDKGCNVDLKETPNGRMYLARNGRVKNNQIHLRGLGRYQKDFGNQ